MTGAPRYEVLWTATALDMLAGVGDRRIKQAILDVSRRLQNDPEKQGKPLREGLFGYRALRAVGQRYRLIYSVDPVGLLVHVVALGLRQEGSRDDIYELAQRMVRLGLSGAPERRAPVRRVARPRKRK